MLNYWSAWPKIVVGRCKGLDTAFWCAAWRGQQKAAIMANVPRSLLLCQIGLPILRIEDAAHLLRQHGRRERLVQKMRADDQIAGVKYGIFGVAGCEQHLDTRAQQAQL